MALLELVMIVKNSGKIIEHCLETNKKYIDHWTILDTGSTDNTPEIIKNTLKEIPGNLYIENYPPGDFDFSKARNRAFELANKKCKYMIVLDDSYEIANGEKLREYLNISDKKVLNIKIGNLDNEYFHKDYYSNRITKSTSGLRYKYRVHEILKIDNNTKIDNIKIENGFIIDHIITEHSQRSFSRFNRDIEMLNKDLKIYKNDPRLIYYLAYTNLLLNKSDEVKKYCKEFLNLNLSFTNNYEYYFFADYNLACLEFKETNDIEIFQNKMIKIQNTHTERAEPMFKICVILYENGEYYKINKLITNLIIFPKPYLQTTILENSTYEYYIPYLFIDVKIKLGLINEAVPVLKDLITRYPNDQRLLNMKYAICDNLDISKIRTGSKVLVIHTGHIFITWNPAGSTKISGSENMAISMANQFRDLGYRVFIFGQFKEEYPKPVDYQTTIDGIQYIDNSLFSDFCLSYVVDYMIISRFVTNLIYYDNIKKVYLWVHDILPAGENTFLQFHKTKFKAIISVSKWQKNEIVICHKLPEDKVIVSRNAILPKRFLNKNIERTPFRFIYTSSMNRGLDNFVNMIKPLKIKYPSSTFYIFGNSDQIESNILQQIKDPLLISYVFLHERVSQDQLSIELLKSDIWLYPTTFYETYCISAVEAMAAGCLVAGITLGALTEIVDDRGVMAKDTTELLEKLIDVLDSPNKKADIIERAEEWSMKQDFFSLAKSWEKDIFSL